MKTMLTYEDCDGNICEIGSDENGDFPTFHGVCDEEISRIAKELIKEVDDSRLDKKPK